MNLLNEAAKETHESDGPMKLGFVREVRQQIDFLDNTTCPIANAKVKIEGLNKTSFNKWVIGIAHNNFPMRPKDPSRPLLGLYGKCTKPWNDDAALRQMEANEGDSLLRTFTLKLARSSPHLTTRWTEGWALVLMANGNKPEDYVLGKTMVILESYLKRMAADTERSARRADEGKMNMQVGVRAAAEHDMRMRALTQVLAKNDPTMPTEEMVVNTNEGLVKRFEKELDEESRGVEETKASDGETSSGPMFTNADVESMEVLSGIDTVPELVTARGKTVAAVCILLDETGDDDVEHVVVLLEMFDTPEEFVEYQARAQKYIPRFKIYMVAVGRLFDPYLVVNNKNAKKLYASKAQQEVHDSRLEGHLAALEVEDAARAKALRNRQHRKELEQEREELLDVEEETEELDPEKYTEELEDAQRALKLLQEKFSL